jgi:hypothetical protein
LERDAFKHPGNYFGMGETMTWKGFSPVIKLMEATYQKGVKMSKKAFNNISHRIDRDASLPKYYMTIQPQV